MRKRIKLEIKDISDFKKKLLLYSNKLNRFALLDSNNFHLNNSQHTYFNYDFLCAIGIKKEVITSGYSGFKDLKTFNKKYPDWKFGFLSYDLKNEIENLNSKNIDELEFPALHFFIPDIVIYAKNSNINCLFFEDQYTEDEIVKLISHIESLNIENVDFQQTKISLQQRFQKEEYIETVKQLKNHIQKGDIYEVNFCHEFYSHKPIDPAKTFLHLNDISPTPFACYYKIDDKYILSASPERFLKKINHKIISQPIKGTIRRNKEKSTDDKLKQQLYNDPKERAENVMIVDLVRNDLSKTAKKGSVKVEELFGIYSFSQVHQMISTVVSEVDIQTDITEIIKNAYPMGSMTGAPKVRAMKLIEHYEKTKRSIYSGSVGFITPENDFDFNVVIRSILYNESKKYVSFTVGGAITSLSDPEKEYEESLVKAEAMLKVFS